MSVMFIGSWLMYKRQGAPCSTGSILRLRSQQAPGARRPRNAQQRQAVLQGGQRGDAELRAPVGGQVPQRAAARQGQQAPVRHLGAAVDGQGAQAGCVAQGLQCWCNGMTERSRQWRHQRLAWCCVAAAQGNRHWCSGKRLLPGQHGMATNKQGQPLQGQLPEHAARLHAAIVQALVVAQI